MLRLYLDEDTQHRAVIRALNLAGFDCLTVNQTGMRGRSDEDQLAFAASRSRILYTKNASDFQRIHTDWLLNGRDHAGIVVTTQRIVVGEQVRALTALSGRLRADDLRNRLKFLGTYV